MRSTIYTAAFGLLAGWALATLPGIGVHEVQAEKNAAAAGKFEMVSTSMGKSWAALRYNSTTGEAFYIAGSVLQKYEESGPLPTGEYEIQAGTIGEGSRWVTRIEKVSGRSWYLVDTKFVEIKEQAKP